MREVNNMADGKYNPQGKKGTKIVVGSTSTVKAGSDKTYKPKKG